MKHTKHRFNMIELVLAIGIAAIGITSIMALIPLTLRSTRDSAGDSVSADAAYTIFSLIDDAVRDDFNVVYSFNKLNNSRRNFFNDPISPNNIPTLPGDRSYMTNPSSITAENGHFYFFYGQEGKAADFVAEVNIWQVTGSESEKVTRFLRDNGGNVKVEDLALDPSSEGYNPLVRLMVEVSWPATLPYYKYENKEYLFPRTSRVFIREYFDPNYSK